MRKKDFVCVCVGGGGGGGGGGTDGNSLVTSSSECNQRKMSGLTMRIHTHKAKNCHGPIQIFFFFKHACKSFRSIYCERCHFVCGDLCL